MATRCLIFQKVISKNLEKINFSDYLPKFYIFYHFLSMVIELSKYMLIRSNIAELVIKIDILILYLILLYVS